MSSMSPEISTGLAELDASILDFEASWWQADGVKEVEIRARFDLSSARYYQRLNQLLDDPDALAHAPMLVKRLRRLRAKRQEDRSARHLNLSASV